MCALGPKIDPGIGSHIKAAVTGYYPALSACLLGWGVGGWGGRMEGGGGVGAIRSAYHRGSSYWADTVSQSPQGGAALCCKLRNFLPHQVNSGPYRVTGGRRTERRKYLTVVIGGKRERE